jgi:hypothetical protein
MSVGPGDGGEPEHHLADGLGQHAAEAEHHARAELGVAHDAGDQFADALHHGRDQDSDVAVGRLGGAEQLLSGAAQRRLVGEPESDQASLGLVRDRRAAELGHHRIPEPAAGGRGSVRVGDELLGSDRNPETGEQAFGLCL